MEIVKLNKFSQSNMQLLNIRPAILWNIMNFTVNNMTRIYKVRKKSSKGKVKSIIKILKLESIEKEQSVQRILLI